MIILGIESSCDETAAAVVKDGTQILSSVVASSLAIHQKWGGIVPEQAAREQLKYIIPVIKEALNKAFNHNYSTIQLSNHHSPHNQHIMNTQSTTNQPSYIDAIAVTTGPGLIGSLLIGVETAKTLAYVWNKPIVPVNHLLGHIYANYLNQSIIPHQSTHNQHTINTQSTIKFPALCLIVSGGHSELFLMKNHGQFKFIGGTRDDAAGECFDKCSRLLGLGYPGGPAIELAAKKIDQSAIKLPRPMINDDSFDFSFSGLKTAVLRLVKNNQQLTINNQQLIAFELQEAITDVLVTKTLKAAQQLKVKSIIIGGGVAANQRLRDKFQLTIRQLADQQSTMKLFIPDKKLCTDNAAAIAAAAFFNFKPIPWQQIYPNPSLEIL